ncbi:hypothetical protein FQN54_009411 [Arachnomyces sp. PD_36]|nr:hypothetical protein FQN54_009411 [Arachnomyces sp. PD_36]
MSKSRMPLYLGLGVVGAGGYYLYNAGGDTKSATKHFEDDASRAAAKVRGEFGDKHKGAEDLGKKAGGKVDESAEAAQEKARQLEKQATKYTKEGAEKLDKLRQDSAKELNQSLDELDKTVERKTSEAKSGISNWFGGSGKK